MAFYSYSQVTQTVELELVADFDPAEAGLHLAQE